MSHYNNDKELKNLKLTIKKWELQFYQSNERKPLKEDIHLASTEIKEAYTSYWTLKSKLELEKLNKEDVWSEKLNKTYKETAKVQISEGNFKKYCDKIRERSCDANQVSNKKRLNERVIKNPRISVKVDNDNKSACDTTTNCDNADFSTLEAEMAIIKPVKKIMKLNNISKKLKSVNVLSSPLNIKSFEKKLSFEAGVNNEWLERCLSDTVNNSISSDIENKTSITTPSKPESVFGTVKHFDVEIELRDKLKCSPENIPETKQCHSNDTKDSKNDSLSFHSDNEKPLDEAFTHPTPDSDLNETGCTHSDRHLEHQSHQTPIENEIDSISGGDKKSGKRKLSRTRNSKLSGHLERKMANGTLNENYVKVNIKKKKFSRGHRSVNVRKLKWKKWKQRKDSGADANTSSPTGCFRCGQVGHWARNCKELAKSNQPSEDSVDDFDDAPLPTLEEAADLARNSKTNLKAKFSKVSNCTEVLPDAESTSNIVPENVTMNKDYFDGIDPTAANIKPLYDPTVDGKAIETPTDVFNSLRELGYTDFRKGQEDAVMRILSGLSTLVVQPTGSGKSLCYQLPAYMYAKQFKCITLVISPLVSLMEDQVTGLPSCLHAICLHSGMTDIQKKASLQDLTDGKAQILLVSPEAVIGGLAYGRGMLSHNMPPIAFACIDEVHCLSQWSHNFRPSYLQLYKVLTEKFNVKCILGLTATANQSTAKEIISHLGLKSLEESVIGSTGIPENLHLSVSKDKDKDKALIQLLTGDRFSNCSSIIIYCIRRDETERLAAFIRTLLQDQTADEPPTKRKKVKSKKTNFLWTAEAYHAGLAPPRRRSIQKQFMTGKLRVIVATIAFGMGLDKRDVRAIIHFNMPKSFESYVQEIGRAGRDGVDSHCHLFIDNEGKDIKELQRFIFSNSTDRYVIRKLLKKVFLPCQCKASLAECSPSTGDNEKEHNSQLQVCPKHEIAFSISETVQELDLKEENILTFLCYLELHARKWIEVLSPTYSTCSIRCYGGPKQLRALALKSPPIAAAFALDAKKNKKLENISSYDFAVVDVASVMGWNASSVKRILKELEWNDQKRKTGVIVEFSNLSFHIRSPGNLSDDELDEVLDYLYQKVVESEKQELLNLRSLHSVFSKYSHPHYWACSEEAPIAFSQGIKEAVNMYFDKATHSEDAEKLELEASIDENKNIEMCDVRAQIRDIIYTNHDQNFTGRAVARIFHGIGSPCYPSEVWGRVRKFWRCLLHVNFNLLIKLANEELKRAK